MNRVAVAIAAMTMSQVVLAQKPLVTADQVWDSCAETLDPHKVGSCQDPRLRPVGENSPAIVSATGRVSRVRSAGATVGTVELELANGGWVYLNFTEKKRLAVGNRITAECSSGWIDVESKKVPNDGIDSDPPEYEHCLTFILYACKLKALDRTSEPQQTETVRSNPNDIQDM